MIVDYLLFGFVIVFLCVASIVLFIASIKILIECIKLLALIVALLCSEIYFFLFTIGGAMLFASVWHLYGGEDTAYVAALIGSAVSTIIYCGAITLHNFFSCPHPVRKKCTLRTCHPHFYNWTPIQDDIWYRQCYVCHQEYALFLYKYETTVNADGTLSPYLKRTRWGWRKDEALNHEVTDAVTPEMIEQARDNWKEQYPDEPVQHISSDSKSTISEPDIVDNTRQTP